MRAHRAGREKDQAPPDGSAPPQDPSYRTSDVPQDGVAGTFPVGGVTTSPVGGITTPPVGGITTPPDPQPTQRHPRMRSEGGAPVLGVYGNEDEGAGEETFGAQNEEDTDYGDAEVGVATQEGVSQSNRGKREANRLVEKSPEVSSDTPLLSPTNVVPSEPLEQVPVGEGCVAGHQEPEADGKSDARERVSSVLGPGVDDDYADSGGILSRLLGWSRCIGIL